MHNAFLAIAIIVASKNFEVLDIADLKIEKTTEIVEESDAIPNIMDKDFMSGQEGSDISDIIDDVEDYDLPDDDLEILDIDIEEDFAEIKEESKQKKEDPQTKTKEDKEVEEIGYTDKKERDATEQKPAVKEEKEKLKLNKKEEKDLKLKQAISIIEDKDDVEQVKTTKETSDKEEKKKAVQPKLVEKTKESDKKVEEEPKKQQVAQTQEKKEVAKKESKILTSVEQKKIETKKEEYEEDEEFRIYLTEEEKLDLQLNEEEVVNIPLVRPRKKVMRVFVNKDVPEELIAEKRSYDNRHIPVIMNNIDIQNMAKEAIKNNNLEKLRAIVEEFKNPDLGIKEYKTVLNYSTMLKRHRIMTYLIYRGADINLHTPIFSSIKNGDIKGLKLLLERNVKVNVRDTLYKTPLMIAIEKRNTKMALLLVKYGADFRMTNRRGEDSLTLARRFRMIEVEAELLRQNKRLQ